MLSYNSSINNININISNQDLNIILTVTLSIFAFPTKIVYNESTAELTTYRLWATHCIVVFKFMNK